MDSSKIKIFIIVLVIAVAAGAGGYFLRSGGENLKGSFTVKSNDLLSQQKKQQNEKLLSGSYLPKRNLPSSCLSTSKILFTADGSPVSQAKASSFQDLYKYIQNDSGECPYLFSVYGVYGENTAISFYCERSDIELLDNKDNKHIFCRVPLAAGDSTYNETFDIQFFPTLNQVNAIYMYDLYNRIAAIGVFQEKDPSSVNKSISVMHYVK